MQRKQHTDTVGRATPARRTCMAPMGAVAAGDGDLTQCGTPQAGCNGEGRGGKQRTTDTADCAHAGRTDQPAELAHLLACLASAGFKVHRSAHGFLVTRWGWLYAAADADALGAFARRVGVRRGKHPAPYASRLHAAPCTCTSAPGTTCLACARWRKHYSEITQRNTERKDRK